MSLNDLARTDRAKGAWTARYVLLGFPLGGIPSRDGMEDPTREARHKFLNSAVTMAEAAYLACIETTGGTPRRVPAGELNAMAGILAGLVNLFSVANDRSTVKPLGKEALKGGTFSEGGRVIAYFDGRHPVGDLVLTRNEFKAALEILKDAGPATQRG
jgi:hypothetical protein